MAQAQPQDANRPERAFGQSFQRGAMFGLDARIALGVFGIMTTMIGFFAMSKISQARYAATIHELEAIHSAMQQYQGDVGVFVPFSVNGDPDGIKEFTVLYDRSMVAPRLQRHWNGPYIKELERQSARHGEYSVSIGQRSATQACQFGTPCYAWVVLTNVPLRTWETINNYFDGNAEGNDFAGRHQQGRVQASSDSDEKVDLYFRSVEHKGMRG